MYNGKFKGKREIQDELLYIKMFVCTQCTPIVVTFNLIYLLISINML